MMFDTQYFISAFLIAFVAVVYSNILTQHGEIFGDIYNRLYHLFRTDQREASSKPAHPLFKMLIHCEKCVAGQWALWIFLGFHFHGYSLITFIQHILFVGLSIGLTVTFKILYEKFR